MKKKTKTYLLLATVIAIWGTIGYKILSSPSSGSELPNTEIATNFKPPSAKKKDTFSIVADYRDPFLGTLPNKKKTKTKVKPKKIIPETPIAYTGHVTDKDTKKQLFFVTIKGQQHLMGKNDEIENIKFLGGTGNSIKIRDNGKTRTIDLQQ